MSITEATRRTDTWAQGPLGRTGLSLLKQLVGTMNRVRYRGGRFRCPICETRLSTMLPFPPSSTVMQMCPVCRASARHRYLWLVMVTERLLPQAGEQVLHIAPEWIIERKLRRLRGVDYLSVDLVPGRAMVAMDITASSLPDASYDHIICSHVLDLIPSDARAISEMFRILRPGGRLLIQVAVGKDGTTLEDPAINTPELRRQFYGQDDKLRLYGFDLANRLTAAGFVVRVHDPRAELDRETYEAYALNDSTPCWATSSIVFAARKP